MSRSIQLFIDQTINEKKLIDFLNDLIPSGVESVDRLSDDSFCFIQIQEYTEGFLIGLNISWPDDCELGIGEHDMARNISNKFKVKVLWEGNNIDGKWCLRKEDGVEYLVSVLELNDGLDVDIARQLKLL